MLGVLDDLIKVCGGGCVLVAIVCVVFIRGVMA